MFIMFKLLGCKIKNYTMPRVTMRELYKMGVFDLGEQPVRRSTRTIKEPQRFADEIFVKGCGAAPRQNYDETDMK